jgi:hypothetical protein
MASQTHTTLCLNSGDSQTSPEHQAKHPHFHQKTLRASHTSHIWKIFRNGKAKNKLAMHYEKGGLPQLQNMSLPIQIYVSFCFNYLATMWLISSANATKVMKCRNTPWETSAVAFAEREGNQLTCIKYLLCARNCVKYFLVLSHCFFITTDGIGIIISLFRVEGTEVNG